MKRQVRIVSSILVCISLFSAIEPPRTVHAERRTPKIALLLPLSGPLAEWGNAMRLGAELAVTESKTEVHLLVEDSQFQPAVALAAYEKLLQSNRPDALIAFGSGVSIAIECPA